MLYTAQAASSKGKEPAEAMDAVQALLASGGDGKQSAEAVLEGLKKLVAAQVQEAVQKQLATQAVCTQEAGAFEVRRKAQGPHARLNEERRARGINACTDYKRKAITSDDFHGLIVPLDKDGKAMSRISAKAVAYVRKLVQVLTLMHEADGEEAEGSGDLPPKKKAMQGFKVKTVPKTSAEGHPLVVVNGECVVEWTLGTTVVEMKENLKAMRDHVMPGDKGKDLEKFLAALGFRVYGRRERMVVEVEAQDGSKKLKVVTSFPGRVFDVASFAEQHVHGLCAQGRLKEEGHAVKVFVRYDEDIMKSELEFEHRGFIRIPRSKAMQLQQERKDGGLNATPLATVQSYAMSLGLQLVQLDVDEVTKRVTLKNVTPELEAAAVEEVEQTEAAGEEVEDKKAAGEEVEQTEAAGGGEVFTPDELAAAEALVNAANKASEIANAMDLEESDEPFSLGKRKRKPERSSLRKALRLSEFEW